MVWDLHSRHSKLRWRQLILESPREQRPRSIKHACSFLFDVPTAIQRIHPRNYEVDRLSVMTLQLTLGGTGCPTACVTEVWQACGGEAAQHRVQYSGPRVFIEAPRPQRCAAQEPRWARFGFQPGARGLDRDGVVLLQAREPAQGDRLRGVD